MKLTERDKIKLTPNSALIDHGSDAETNVVAHMPRTGKSIASRKRRSKEGLFIKGVEWRDAKSKERSADAITS